MHNSNRGLDRREVYEMGESNPEFKRGTKPAETRPEPRKDVAKVIGKIAVKNATKK